MPGSGSLMVGEATKKQKKDNSVELEASLAPAESEVGAVAKPDQKYDSYNEMPIKVFN